MSFKDVEGQGRDDNPFRKKKKKNLNLVTAFSFLGIFFF